MIVGQVSTVLLVVFATDAAVSVWRRGDRRLALLTGGSIVFCVLGASVQGFAVLWGSASWPFLPSPFFIATVVAMSYEMSRNALRAANSARIWKRAKPRFAKANGGWTRRPWLPE